MMHWGDCGIGFGFGWVFMILFWGLVVLGAIYLVKMLAGGVDKSRPKETAGDILRNRFASGELSKEEFEKAMQILKQQE